MGKLDGKVAVVTGATSGMGLATAKLFVEQGAYVFITGRRKPLLDAAAKEIGRNVTAVQADSGRLEDLERLYATVKSEKGHVDVIFASAGAGELGKPLGTITAEEFANTFNVNVRGTIFTVQNALPLLRPGASIILNGTVGAIKGFPGTGVYGASKAAVRSLARTWTMELKDKKIRVNVIHPGAINTAAQEAVPPAMKEMLVQMIPFGRIGEPIEIATAALFLASSDSSYISGIELFVDGGWGQV